MLGWEYPPLISGGLGTACQGLVRAINRKNVDVVFVLPNAIEPEEGGDELSAVPAAGRRAVRPTPHRPTVRVRRVDSPWIDPYAPKAGRQQPPRPMRVRREPGRARVVGAGGDGGYEGDLLGKIDQFTRRCLHLAGQTGFDLIHAHDWMTFPAASAVAAATGRPWIAHVHATEFDRASEAANPTISSIEQQAVADADAVLAVSHLTARTLIDGYGAAAEKVHVVHNGVAGADPADGAEPTPSGGAGGRGRDGGDNERTVLFLGRLTAQKGPGRFVQMAAMLAAQDPAARFLVAGWGDLGPAMVERVAATGLGDRFRFAGFLRGGDVARAYRMADVYVMPSVREPFGLTALEAVRHGASVVVSKTAGVAEVLQEGALHVDHWDVPAMAAKVRRLLDHPDAAAEMHKRALAEIEPLTWDRAADACRRVYRTLMDPAAARPDAAG